jgi:hypothetical protein
MLIVLLTAGLRASTIATKDKPAAEADLAQYPIRDDAAAGFHLMPR